MPKYGVQYVLFTTSTAAKSIIGAYMLTDATRNGEIVEVICTGDGATAAADVQHRCELAGFTFGATGVSTTATPVPFNPTGPAALGNFGVNYSTEPTTITTALSGHPVSFGFNQRGGMRWAVPQGEGFRIANYGTTEKGATMQVISSAAGMVQGNLHFWQAN